MASIQPNVSGRMEDDDEEVESRQVEKASGHADPVLEDDDDTDDEEWINEDWTLYSIWHSYFDDFPNKLQRRRFSKTKKTFLNEVIPEVEQLFPKFPTVSLLVKKLMVLMVSDFVAFDGDGRYEVEACEISFRKPSGTKAVRKVRQNVKLRVHGKLALIFYLTLQKADLLVLDEEILRDDGDDVLEVNLETCEETAIILRLIALNDKRLKSFKLGEKIQPKVKTNDDVDLPRIPYRFEYLCDFQGSPQQISTIKFLPTEFNRLYQKRHGRKNCLFPVIANSTKIGQVGYAMACYGVPKDIVELEHKGPQKGLKFARKLIIVIAILCTIFILLSVACECSEQL